MRLLVSRSVLVSYYPWTLFLSFRLFLLLLLVFFFFLIVTNLTASLVLCYHVLSVLPPARRSSTVHPPPHSFFPRLSCPPDGVIASHRSGMRNSLEGTIPASASAPTCTCTCIYPTREITQDHRMWVTCSPCSRLVLNIRLPGYTYAGARRLGNQTIQETIELSRGGRMWLGGSR